MEQRLPSVVSLATTAIVPSTSTSTPVSHHHHQQQLHHQKNLFIRSVTLGPQSPALRPEELRVKPWYALDEHSPVSKDSPPANFMTGDQSSCSAYQSSELDNNNYKEVVTRRGIDIASTRTSSIESENPRTQIPRRACMDLNDAIALLDEIYSNTDASPRMTPKTPRTPLTPHPRSKRARSKSSDNSSNYSGERLNERFLENVRTHEKERKRPFLKKIGISMTEDRPLLAKLAPKIMGKPYLEKIGPSRAVDKPFLENIDSSKTIDKFIFDTPKINKRQDISMSSKIIIADETKDKASIERRNEIRGFTTGERRRSGKNFLLKMYSFETEDLEENSVMTKAPHRDPLRGASLDDVVDSGPTSMPRINESCAMTNSDIETPSTSVTELVKCRVTTSEEIISSNSCLNSPMDVISWENSPKRRGYSDRNHENTIPSSDVAFKEHKDNVSVPNSPINKIRTSVTPKRLIAMYKELDNVKGNRQISEDILDKRKSRHEQFERRGISSDNLTKEKVATPVFAEISGISTDLDDNGKGSNTSVVSTTSSIKQMHDRFENQEIFTESYAEFKRRTQGNYHTSNALKRLIIREKTGSPLFSITSKDVTEKIKIEASPKFRSKSVESNRQNYNSNDQSEAQSRRTRTRSVLRKQQGVDHSHYPREQNELEPDLNQRQKIFQEPSQETLDLLSELRKVKSLLKTPSIDKPYETDSTTQLKSFPKRILLTDKEFCLSIERENSIRRPSRMDTIELKHDNLKEKNKSPENIIVSKTLGPALFEKRCLSLDYADEEKATTQKTEPRTLSLALAKSPHSEDNLELSEIALITYDSKSYNSDVFSTSVDETNYKIISGISVEKEVKKIENDIQNSKQECLNETSKKQSEDDKYSNRSEPSYTFRPIEKIEILEPTKDEVQDNKKKDEVQDNKKKNEVQDNKKEDEVQDNKKEDEVQDNTEKSTKQKNHSEIDSTNYDSQVSPKKKGQSQSNVSDSFEISSPKATPFRMKKRLGRISIEETVKQESFAVNKVDCKEVTVQKRAKCLPL